MLTRCPSCATAFRVTPEQLKVRSGTVRCGKCQTIFNALDSLVDAPLTAPAPDIVPPTDLASPPPPTPDPRSAMPGALAETPDTTFDILMTPAAASGKRPDESATDEECVAVPATQPPEPAPAPEAIVTPTPQADGAPEESPSSLSADALRDKAVAAGLVAARETTAIPGYNKWAEGALMSSPASVSAPARRPLWPFILVALVLLLALAGQMAHFYRAELAVAAPGLRPLLASACAALDCDIPLPRHVDQVSIEASDLQVDPAQGGALTLSATLKNRAAYAQAWPLLEITLTDVQDNAVLRRVLRPADYLPQKADPTLFPPNGEIGIRLWLEAKDVTAAGYRLYVFYP